MEGHRLHRLFVDFEPEHIGPGVVADHIEIELGTRQIGQIEIGAQDALLAIFRPGQYLSQRPDDAASATNERLLRGREPIRWVIAGQIAAPKYLTCRQDEATAFEGDVRYGRQ